MAFYSTKRFGPISTGHRQWRDDGHCAYMHGYGRTMKVIFGASALDDKGWVVDFGGLKDFKKWLEGEWDHRMLIASDDPALAQFIEMDNQGLISLNVMEVSYGHGPGIEASCKYVYDYLDPYVKEMTAGRCWVESIEIWEHELNSAILVRDQVNVDC